MAAFMNCKENCWDNVVAGYFFGSPKDEWIGDLFHQMRGDTMRDVREYMTVFSKELSGVSGWVDRYAHK
jgi:hypothetical protein